MGELTLKQRKELLDYEHKLNLKIIETRKNAELEVEKVKFDYTHQLQRIKRADIQRTINNKVNKEFNNNYWRKE